jgi:NADP-dependent 3-hydroxy acid dehydrogenase YdfG
MTNETHSGRTIFITGAGAGIGAATARRFARAGWRVGASDVDGAALERLRDELGAERCSIAVADVRDRAAMAGAVSDFARANGGRLDTLFANAGVLFMGPDESLTPAQRQQLIDVNVTGVVNTFDAALPWLKRAAPGAHAVAMASTSAEYGSPLHAVYSATKFFVRGYTEALHLEYRPAGIHVSGVYVSYVQTGMVSNANYKPPTIERMGVNATAAQVADVVWKAAHGRRAHWRVGFDARFAHYAARLLGAGVGPIYARLAGLGGGRGAP